MQWISFPTEEKIRRKEKQESNISPSFLKLYSSAAVSDNATNHFLIREAVNELTVPCPGKIAIISSFPSSYYYIY